MKHSLAEDLFAAVVGLGEADTDERVRLVRPLQHMATYKFDEYGGYGAGIKFLETLAIWLNQFDPEERKIALDFVQTRLIFLSDQEIQHALSLAYQDLVRPALIRRAAAATHLPPWRVAQVLKSSAFRLLQRRSLFLGLADGARLDQFRRANPALVHEQFCVTAEPPDRVAKDLQADLSVWLEREGSDTKPTFRHFVLVDDFSGSGFTALRWSQKRQAWGGKLHHVKKHLDYLVEIDVAESDYTAQVLLYTASENAEKTLTKNLQDAGFNWNVSVVQLIPEGNLVDPGSAFADLCRHHHDPYVDDKVKEDADSPSAALGFRDSRLPLVLSHNTPNNSVGVLWENTADEPGSQVRFTPLFPRHERHKADR